jgi:hypothetical protein
MIATRDPSLYLFEERLDGRETGDAAARWRVRARAAGAAGRRECSMEEARGERPMDLRESVRVLQVTGCFPLPLSQRLIISMVILSASS